MEGIQGSHENTSEHLDMLFSVLHTLSGMENDIQLLDSLPPSPPPHFNYLLAY